MFCAPNMPFQKIAQTVVALSDWLLHLSTLGNMSMQGVFIGKLNRSCLFNIMAAQKGLNFQT